MAVFGHISNSLTEDVLEVLLDESDLSLLTIENQVTGVESVPDAAIRSSSAIWFETKTVRDAVGQDQLERHLKALDQDNSDEQRLVALTPDAEEPQEVRNIDDDRLVWANFSSLVDAIESLLDRDLGTTEDVVAIPTEREAFLLRELVRFIYDEDLVSGKEDRVLVVAARKAWPEYEDHTIYFCQPGRSFKPVEHMAFYTDGEIKPAVPRVVDRVDDVLLTEAGVEEHDGLSESQKEKLMGIVGPDMKRHGDRQQVIFLEDDVTLSEPIRNDKTASDSDRGVAFVQGHRYVSLSALRDDPSGTTDLEE
ncbi:hypothetical protein ACFQE1_07775 [Halobium palmae]|uniref:Uncharacterized protein n=1 Tax=Halobium palmae TaxID=1776492 RepID=A0ABD5RZ42_9EURY